MKIFTYAVLVALLAPSFATAAGPASAQSMRSADVVVSKQDRDGDHRISRKEWRGAPERFDRIDKNADGFLTLPELESRGRPASKEKPGGKQPIIDVHVHIFPDASTTVEQRLAMDFDDAADRAIASMDRNKVLTSIIMGTPSLSGLFDGQVLFAQAKRYPGRFAVLGGGGTLNPIIHRIAPAQVTEEVERNFEAKAEGLLSAGAIGFGEMAALHFSYFRHHSFEEVPPDHPLLLLLADIAARHDVPIDLHCEIVPNDMAVPAKLIKQSIKNPPRVHANLASLERLLAHNPRTQIILSHSVDSTGFRTAGIIRGLLERHPNMSMSLNVFPKFVFPENLPLQLTGGVKPEWLRLIKDYPDRFMLGSDQRYSAPCQACKMADRIGPTRRWLDVLPPDIALKIAFENPRRVFRMDDIR
jgi:predicted TIM-barrel fold metal-dependent hydrolase